MYIGKHIKNFRLEKNVTQETLADYLGVSYQAVSKWETEMSTPDISLLPKIATYFGISIDELFQIPSEQQFERIYNMCSLERRIHPEAFSQSISFLEDILKNHPDHIEAYTALAYLYNHRAHSDHELAAHYAKKILALDPNHKGGRVAYVEALGGVCGDGWYDSHFELIEYFKEFLVKNPDNVQGHCMLIENLLDDDRYDEAIPYIESLRQLRDTQEYLMHMGDVAYGKCDLERAKAF